MRGLKNLLLAGTLGLAGIVGCVNAPPIENSLNTMKTKCTDEGIVIASWTDLNGNNRPDGGDSYTVKDTFYVNETFVLFRSIPPRDRLGIRIINRPSGFNIDLNDNDLESNYSSTFKLACKEVNLAGLNNQYKFVPKGSKNTFYVEEYRADGSVYAKKPITLINP